MLNFQKMMQQAQQMQFKLQEMQEKLADIEVEGQSGAGLVSVRMNCKGEVLSLNIDPSLLAEKETLEDLVIAAVNNANMAKEDRIKQETSDMMQSMGLPAGAQLPF
jgi:hypothetical protein